MRIAARKARQFVVLGGVLGAWFAGAWVEAQEEPAGGEQAVSPNAPGNGVAGDAVTDDAATVDATNSGPTVRAPTIYVIGTPEELLDIGGSGAVIRADEFRSQSYDDVSQALRKVPGVYLRGEDGFGLFPNISLRGVDTTRSAKVTVMEDGVLTAPATYSAPAAYYSPTAGRMSSIEVLKGSSQILYGPHITGGVINYQSTPIPLERTIYLKALYGRYNEQRAHAYVGETVSTEWGDFGFLVEGYYRASDGFKRIDKTPDFRRGADETGFTNGEPLLKLSWEPNTAVYNRFEVKLGYSDRNANETYLGLAEDDFDDDPFRRYAATRFDEIQSNHGRSYLRHTIEPTDSATLTTTAYYNRFHRDWFKLQDVRDENGVRQSLSRSLAEASTHLRTLRGEAAGELRVRHNDRTYYVWGVESVWKDEFTTGDIDHEVTGSARFHYDKVRRDQRNELFTQEANGTISARDPGVPGDAGRRQQKSRALALAVQDRLRFRDWAITPGLRYEHVDQRFSDSNTLERGQENLDLLAGGIGATYDLTGELSFFGGVHSGYSIPGPRAASRNDLEEERSYGVELGPRYTHASGALRAEGAVFFTRFRDLIVIDNVGGTGTGDTENAGTVNTYGVEFAAAFDPGAMYQWEFKNPWHLSFTYTRAELRDDSQSTDAESIFSGAEKGNLLPYIPEFVLSFGTGIEWGDYGAFVSGSFTDSMFTSANNTSRQINGAGQPDARFGKTDSYVVVDLALHYQMRPEARLLAGVHNLFDEEYVASRHPHGPRPGQPLFAYVGLELTLGGVSESAEP